MGTFFKRERCIGLLGFYVQDLVKKVKLADSIDVNTIAINRDRYFSNAYVVDLPLESAPNHVWQDILERQWKASRHLWDRKLFVICDKLRLVTTMEDIEDKIDWVKQVVEQTNKDVDEYNQEITARAIQIEEQTREKNYAEEKMNVDTIRDTLRKRLQTI